MSRQITQPVNQVRLTNVAVVRLKTHGKRFEVAAYKNKVMNWRARIETDINEVLQVTTVFANVSKGVIAKGEDLKEAFQTDDHTKVALIILDRGELEVSDKERALIYDSLFRDVATIVADKCVNPETKRPYTLSMIEKALRDAHFSVNPSKGAKQQALKAVALLQRSLHIERAHMTVRVTVPSAEGRAIRSLLLDTMHARLDGESHPGGDAYAVDATLEPGFYKALEAEVAARARGHGTVEVLSFSVQTDEDDGAGGVGTSAPGGGNASSGSSAAVGSGTDASGLSADMGRLGLGASGGADGGAAGGHGSASAGGVGAAPAAAASNGAGLQDATTAASRGTGMMVRRVTQPGRRLACSACAATFESSDEHREHHRSDWHRYNLKRKMKGGEPVTAEAFASIPAKERKAFIEDYD